ncbi:unnamed protein product [Urochloa humidicola]
MRTCCFLKQIVGCPKTINGDLRCKEVPTSFGFDIAGKIYSEMIGNVMTDARSTGEYYRCELLGLYGFVIFVCT